MTRVSVNGYAYTHWGKREIEDLAPSRFDGPNEGQETLQVTFSYDDLPAASSDDNLILTIPANSVLVSADIRVHTAFAGGTSYDFGLAETDGTAIDADGIDAAVATAALTAGAYIACDGALIGANIGSADGQITVAATGTYTAGKATLTVVYQPLVDRA